MSRFRCARDEQATLLATAASAALVGLLLTSCNLPNSDEGIAPIALKAIPHTTNPVRVEAPHVEPQFKAVRSGNKVTLTATGAYYFPSGRRQLLVRRNNVWVPVRDELSGLRHAGYYLDGGFLPPQTRRLCGGVIRCTPFTRAEWEATEVVFVGTRMAPKAMQKEVAASQFDVTQFGIRKSRAGSEAQPVPVAEARALNEDLAVSISYFSNETCQGPPIVATIPVVTVEAPSTVTTVDDEQKYNELVNTSVLESFAGDAVRARAERKSTHRDRTRNNATPPRARGPFRAGLRQSTRRNRLGFDNSNDF